MEDVEIGEIVHNDKVLGPRWKYGSLFVELQCYHAHSTTIALNIKSAVIQT